jgi:hypothetical protein
VQTFTGVASGSFGAPDHEYPSYLELELTATDSGGLTGSRRRADVDDRADRVAVADVVGRSPPAGGPRAGLMAKKE